MNILLADDSVPAQNMGKKILMDAGYGVVTVSNGLEALRKIAEAAPDIAILDIFMPGYTGLEICKRLRASAATAALPVILTVGKLEPYRPEDGEQVQSNAVIVKPFAAAELISAVRSLIGGPLDEAEAAPAPGSASKAVAGPLQQSPLAAEAATPEPLGQEEADEPLFASRATAFDPNAPSVYRPDSPFLDEDSADSSAPASLAFDPDAKQTPFSASAFEVLSPASQPAPETVASAFTEFDLAPEPSPHSAAPQPEPEPGYAAPPFIHAGTQQAAQEELLAADASVIAVADPPAAPEVIASASSAPAELETSTLDIPALDPLLEWSAAYVPSAVPESSILEAGEPAGHAESAAQDAVAAEVVPASGTAESEEEARRAAFEALFNSPEPLPLDTVLAPPAAFAPVTPQDFAELPEDYAYKLKPEPEIESLPYLAATELDLNPSPSDPVEEVQLATQPFVAIDTTPDPSLETPPDLLEDAWDSTESPEALSEWQPEEAIASAPTVTDSPQPIEALESAPAWSSVLAPSPEDTLAEAHPILAEAEPVFAQAPAEPVAYDPAPLANFMPAALGIAEAALQARPEFVPSQAVPPEPVQLEAGPHSMLASEVVPLPTQPAAPELLHSEAEMPLADPLADVPVEAAPAHLPATHVEAAPAQLEATPVPVFAPVEAEPLEADTLQSEPQAEAIFPSPAVSSRLLEAERIHHAIERVFDRFKPLLVAAIVRELARQDPD